MKELKIEQKAQRYDEALELAAKFRKEYLNYKELNVHKGVIEAFNSIFPELKESEDNRMRKHIINILKDNFSGEDTDKCIAWLEKREQKPVPDWIPKFLDELRSKKNYFDWDEHKDIEGRILAIIKWMSPNYFNGKGGEMKSADKVEPKFHKEDWVVWDNKISCHVDNIYQGKNSLMYTITDTNNMTRSYSVKGFDNNAHLWTINDAKDGDVLACPNDAGDRDVVFIFKNINIDEGWVFCYCAIDANGCFCTNNDYVGNYNSTNISPATKEQRDTLEKAMADAGYTFDFEKKELKKLSHQEVTKTSDQVHVHVEWYREDEQNLNACLGYIPDEFLRRWLTDAIHVKYDKHDWSEEDTFIINKILYICNYYEKSFEHTSFVRESIKEDVNKIDNWLKSLKDRYAWKPSKIQLETLKELSHDFPTKRGIIEEILKHLKQL